MPTHPKLGGLHYGIKFVEFPLCSTPFHQTWVEISTKFRRDIAGFVFDRNWLSPNAERQYWLALKDLNFATLWLENHPFQAMNRFGSNEKENHCILVRKAFPITFTSIKKLPVWFGSPIIGSETMLVDGKGSVLRFEILMNFNTQGHTGGLHLHHFTSQSVRKGASRPADQLLLRKECP